MGETKQANQVIVDISCDALHLAKALLGSFEQGTTSRSEVSDIE
jgi:hypothetical protein